VRFGFATDTYDADGEPSSTAQSVNLQFHQLSDLAARFRGVIEQMPPPFSAKKVHGVPAYKLARKKKEVDILLKPVRVEIKEFEILSVEGTSELPRPRLIRNLHAVRGARNGPATGLWRPLGVAASYRRRRIQHQ